MTPGHRLVPRGPLPLVATLTVALILTGCHPNSNDTRSATEGVPDIEQQLTANDWRLDHGASSLTATAATGRITILFDAGGRLSGSAPCNRYSGSFVIDQNDITISNVISTQNSCPPPVMVSEREYLTALQRVHHVQPTNRDQLQLTGGPAITLTYNAARSA
jgi:heat shock protein HslJ